jgi:hypothetical protein
MRGSIAASGFVLFALTCARTHPKNVHFHPATHSKFVKRAAQPPGLASPDATTSVLVVYIKHRIPLDRLRDCASARQNWRGP